MLKAGIIVVIVGLLMFMASASFAAENNPMGKLQNGLSNMLTGWYEIPKKMKETYEEDKSIVAGVTIGTLKGAIYCVGRTAAGILDTVSFFIAPYDQPLMEPDWVLFGEKEESIK